MLKRFAVVLMLSASCFAAIGSIQGGAFQDPAGNPLNGGTLTLTLSGPAQIIGTGQILPGITYTITLNSLGSVPAATPLWQNDQLSPSGTYYIATLYSAAGALVRGPENWVIQGTSPVDLGTITAATPSINFTPFFAFSGVFTNTQQNNNVYSAVGGISPTAWFTQQGGNHSTDAIAGGSNIPASASVHQVDGIAGYISNGCNSLSAAVCNGVALYGSSGANANGSSNWGINTVTYSGATTTGTWQLNEFDTNVTTGSAPTLVEGLQFNGVGSGTMPSAFSPGTTTLAGAAMMDVWTQFLTLGGSAYQWPLGINFRRSSVNGTAIQIDGTCRTGNCSSALLTFTGYNPSAKTATLFSDLNGNLISTPIAAGGTQAVLSGTGACATLTTQSGGSFAGNVSCTGSTGASTLVITPGTTAPNGWSCFGSDNSSGHELAGAQTGGSNTTCTLKFSSITSNDFINFGAIAF